MRYITEPLLRATINQAWAWFQEAYPTRKAGDSISTKFGEFTVGQPGPNGDCPVWLVSPLERHPDTAVRAFSVELAFSGQVVYLDGLGYPIEPA